MLLKRAMLGNWSPIFFLLEEERLLDERRLLEEERLLGEERLILALLLRLLRGGGDDDLNTDARSSINRFRSSWRAFSEDTGVLPACSPLPLLRRRAGDR
jgi:hypothetical protein